MSEVGRPAVGADRLGRGRLRVWDAVGQSVGLLALVMALAISTSQIAGFAGPAAPLVYLVAGDPG